MHGFMTQTGVVAYCGAVERPTRPRVVDVVPPADACPACVTAYAAIKAVTT